MKTYKCSGVAGARIGAALLAVMAGLVAVAPAARAEYPEKVIAAIVPFSTGGTSDLMARVFAAAVSKELGQTVIIENKPGAGGNIGINAMVTAKPDGYTILFSSVATTQNPAIYRNLPFDPIKDVQPIAQLGENPNVIAVNVNKFPAGNLQDFIALIKKNPSKLNFSTADSGMIVNRFLLATGLDVTIVPFTGSGDSGTALMSGEVDCNIGGLTTAMPGISAGKVRVLAVTGPQRISALPDVPTTGEAGLNYIDMSHFGAYVRSGTPAAIVQKLNTAFNKTQDDPQVIERIRSFGYSPTKHSTEEFQKFYLEEIARWKEVVAKGHIKPLD